MLRGKGGRITLSDIDMLAGRAPIGDKKPLDSVRIAECPAVWRRKRRIEQPFTNSSFGEHFDLIGWHVWRYVDSYCVWLLVHVRILQLSRCYVYREK